MDCFTCIPKTKQTGTTQCLAICVMTVGLSRNIQLQNTEGNTTT